MPPIGRQKYKAPLHCIACYLLTVSEAAGVMQSATQIEEALAMEDLVPVSAWNVCISSLLTLSIVEGLS